MRTKKGYCNVLITAHIRPMGCATEIVAEATFPLL